MGKRNGTRWSGIYRQNEFLFNFWLFACKLVVALLVLIAGGGGL